MVKEKRFEIRRSALPIGRCAPRGGFTLVEVLVAMAVLAVILVGLTASATSVMRTNRTSYFNTIAANLAQDKLEELRAKTPADVIPGGPVVSTVSGAAFTRSWMVAADSPVIGVKRVDVTVQWTDYVPHSLTISAVVPG